MSGGRAYWLIFGVLVFVIRHLDYLNLIYQTDIRIRVVTPLDSSELCPVTAGVPQGAIWSPPLFNLYIHQLPTVVKHSLIVGYADDHSLLKIIADKSDHIAVASDLNCDLAALYHFGQSWQIKYAPNKTSSLLVSLKRDLQTLPHPPLFLNDHDSVIPETSSVRGLRFTFDSLLTRESHSYSEHIESWKTEGQPTLLLSFFAYKSRLVFNV